MRWTWAVVGALLLSVARLDAASASSTQEVRFGMEAARKSLWREARFRFERALKLDPSNVAAMNDLGVACEEQGDFAQARQSYESAIKLRPKDHSIQQNYDLFREADDKRQQKSGNKKP